MSLVKLPLTLCAAATALLAGNAPLQPVNAAENTPEAAGPRYGAAAQPVTRANPDWLVEPAPYQAVVLLASDKRSLTLSNGLIRRVLRLAPNAATVEYDDPLTGQTILRAVKPEAELTLNGQKWAVGGLVGQPCQNYLSPPMLAQMVSAPGAYQFIRWEERRVEKRFDWTPHPEWLSRAAIWPAPGKHVVLHFAPPAAAPEDLSGAVLFEEAFKAQIKEGWTIHTSPSHPRASFSNEGKPGEIYALPDTCVYAERPWPEGAVALEVTLDVGDDREANSWGPGLAVIAGSEAVSLVARPASASFEATGTGLAEQVSGRFDRGGSVTLRARLAGHVLFLEANQTGKPAERVAVVTLRRPPATIRVGKVGKGGSGTDSNWRASNEPRRSHVLRVVARGPETRSPAARDDLPEVQVHYEIYDGIPVIAKWLCLTNTTGKSVRLDAFASELLATVETAPKIDEGWSRSQLLTGMVPRDQKLLQHPTFLNHLPEAPLDYLDRFMDLFVVTDYAMGGDMEAMKDNPAVHWKHDPAYRGTGIQYYGLYQPAMLECSPPAGPALDLAAGERWESFRTFEMLRDASDRERRGLAECRFWSTFAPWTRENPIYMHITFSNPAKICAAIDQCAEVGFEMIILSFGSGYDPESRDSHYQQTMKELVQYAKAKGIVLGGYSLLASRGGAPDQLCLAKDTGKPAGDRIQGSHFGASPCLCSAWGLDYFQQLRAFYQLTGAGVLEHDGSYPGDLCASTNHIGHRDFYDSQWRQWLQIQDFYRWCCGQGIYLNVPDWHFLNGSCKEPMGYVENNWSLPREDQQIITRQNIYDGTFVKGPTMGWMFVPLTEYHGGGAAATVEPLSEHLDHYETQLASLFGAGVQACYRGPRLFDTQLTKAMVKRWVDFYKTHRPVLDSDLVHLRRADGRDWDGWLHVNPLGREKGLAMFYNPLPDPIQRHIRLPLYYTGLTGQALLKREDGTAETVTLNRDYSAEVAINLAARSRTWLTIFAPDGLESTHAR